MKTRTKAWSGSEAISAVCNASRRLRFGLLLIIMAGVSMVFGCYVPTVFLTSVSLPPGMIGSDVPYTPPGQGRP
ncbi:MAG: hypothetical protein H8E17_02655, partial [Deltaproteobacteria bacterium]|nr:hypothetical protein [Deltaproteobacteria bacterium]